MDIKKAYEIYEAIEKLTVQDKAINNLYKVIAIHESFDRGELRFCGNNLSNEPILHVIPVKKENIKLFLDLLLESMTDKKEEIIKQIEEL